MKLFFFGVGGDRIELVAPDGIVVQVVSYDRVREDEIVMANLP